MNTNLILALSLLTVGLALILTIDPWFIGLVFILIGGQRLVVGAQEHQSDKP